MPRLGEHLVCDDRKAELWDRYYRRKQSLARIAQVLGVSKGAVWKAFERWGWKRRSCGNYVGRRMTEKELAARQRARESRMRTHRKRRESWAPTILEMLDAGKTRDEIAARIGITPRNLTVWFRDLGFERVWIRRQNGHCYTPPDKP
jgi:hypothetical protein